MNLENATEILLPLIESGDHDPDSLMTALANAGFKITTIPKFVNTILETAGLRLSPTNRASAVAEFMLENAPESFGSWDAVIALATQAADEIGSSTVPQVVSALKKWAKANGIELPAQTKVVSAGGTRSNQFDRFRVAYQANPSMTDAEIAEYALATITKSGEPNPKQAAKYEVAFLAAANLARTFQ
tara:strand:- start:1744 stop:2304 length:561 start_codon:yes stop_codon:yes gene_type:complete